MRHNSPNSADILKSPLILRTKSPQAYVFPKARTQNTQKSEINKIRNLGSGDRRVSTLGTWVITQSRRVSWFSRCLQGPPCKRAWKAGGGWSGVRSACQSVIDRHVSGRLLLRVNFILRHGCFAPFTFPGSHKHIVMLSKKIIIIK